MDKYKSKQALFRISTPEERKDLELFELAELNANYEKVMRTLGELGNSVSGSAKTKEVATMMLALAEGIKKIKSDYSTQAKQSIEAFREMQEEFLKGLGTLRDVLKEQDFNKNAGPLYKTMINSISGVEKAIKERPQAAAWRWPQYAAVSVRNKNFANINPSISPFGIEDYDEIDLTYTGANITGVTYKLNGTVMGVLTLSYSGSNITKVVRS